ncbi:MAG: hypothetical protein WCF81_11455 [Roseiarcus sp.]
MNSLVPQAEETLDVILSAYAEIGIHVVFSIAIRDVGALDIAPFLPSDVSEAAMAIVRGVPKDAREEVAFVERQIKRLTPLPPRLTWGLESLRATAFIACFTRRSQRPCAALRAANPDPCV